MTRPEGRPRDVEPSGSDRGGRTVAFGSFEEFWPHYVREHGRRGNRRLHFAGTLLGLLCFPAAVVLREPWALAAGPVLGYGAAWIGHFLVERNRPATFRHPLWSFRGDVRMVLRMATGRMDDDVRRCVGR